MPTNEHVRDRIDVRRPKEATLRDGVAIWLGPLGVGRRVSGEEGSVKEQIRNALGRGDPINRLSSGLDDLQKLFSPVLVKKVYEFNTTLKAL